MNLTPKQEKFCQGIVSGKSAKDSYLAAYNCNSDNAAMVESTKLMGREDIQARIKELLKPIENLIQKDAITEYQRLKDIAWEGIENCKANGDHNGIARYMDILNKMLGNYVNINKNIEESTPLNTLDTETLKKLSEDV